MTGSIVCIFSTQKKPSVYVEDFSINPNYPDGKGLADYIMSGAFNDEKNGECRTYLVLDNETNELAAYFTLRSGQVYRSGIFDERESHSFETLSGTELVCFAVNHSYVLKHEDMKGYGIVVFDELIMPLVTEISTITGAPILYGYAVNGNALMNYYINKCGFLRLPTDLEEIIYREIKPEFPGIFCNYT